MPTFIPAHGHTLHVAGVCINRIGKEWMSVFGNQRLTGALLDRLTHHAHILELNGESYRLKQSKARRRQTAQPAIEIANSDTAEDADS